MIVDEEQRFGVEHKEHITALRTHVDVLTLSATPIPRTLEMSLAGIREMSTITTPPEDRHPTLTYVGAYDEKLVAAAIRRELLRDGQVFYVHNRVSSIDRAARHGARAGAGGADRRRARADERGPAGAHGQRVLAQRVRRAGLHDDRGERAGHLQRQHADRRARPTCSGCPSCTSCAAGSGRGRERGYAYFLFPPEHPLTETAHDRLATIAQHSELGAGTAVAMKDLEIRGAGNILGAEQSGHIAGVGFDLYIRLVGEAVAAFRKQAGRGRGRRGGERCPRCGSTCRSTRTSRTTTSTASGCGWRSTARSPRRPTAPRSTRSSRSSTDRYGEPPQPVRNLLAVAAFRQSCRAFGVAEVTVAGNAIRVAPLDLPDSAQLRLKRLLPARAVQARVPGRHGAAAGRGRPDRRRGPARHRPAGLVHQADQRPVVVRVGPGRAAQLCARPT